MKKYLGIGLIVLGVAILIPIYLWFFNLQPEWMTEAHGSLGILAAVMLISIGFLQAAS